VESGHDLIIVPARFQTSAPGLMPAWLGVRLAAGQTNHAGLAVVALDKSAAVFSDLRDARGEVALHNIKAFQFYTVDGEKNALLGTEDSRVLLAERRFDKGRVFVSGAAFDPSWMTLPLNAGFLALAQRMALLGTESRPAAITVVAGQPLTFLETGTVHVQSLTGTPLDWKGKNLLTLPRSGVYKIRGSRETIVAVRSAEKEGQERFLTAERVPALSNLPYRVENFNGPGDLLLGHAKPERALDLFLPLLLLASMAWAGESWLANQRVLKKKVGPSGMAQQERAKESSWSMAV
jgi:hypothetical protein